MAGEALKDVSQARCFSTTDRLSRVNTDINSTTFTNLLLPIRLICMPERLAFLVVVYPD